MRFSTLISKLALLLLGFAHFVDGLAVSGADNPMPQVWEIDLQPAFKRLGEPLDSAPQQEMNRITAARMEIRDVELSLVYLELWARLPGNEQDKLKAEQAKWLVTRTKQAAKAAESEEGGSLAPTESNLAATGITEKRIANLRKRLSARAENGEQNRADSAVPNAWSPDLQGAIDWLESDSEDGPVTAIARNRRLQFELRDAELALCYLKLWTRLDKKKREALKTEQTEWLASRTRKAAAAAEGQSEETLAALQSHRAARLFTEKRITELQQRLSTKSAVKKPKG